MKALVISGGGSKGAFSAGILCKLAERKQASFDLYAGTSTGAILAVLALGEKYDRIAYWYNNVTTSMLLKKRCVLTALLFANSLYKTENFLRHLEKEFTQDFCQQVLHSKKILLLTATNFATGELVCFSNQNIILDGITIIKLTSAKDLHLAIMASSAQPVFMPLVEFQGKQYADGGLKEVSPLKPAILAGATEIWALDNNAHSNAQYTDLARKIPAILERGLDFLTGEILQNDIDYAEMINEALLHFQKNKEIEMPDFLKNKKLLKLRLIRPKNDLLTASLDFNTEKMCQLFQQGYNFSEILGDI